MKSQGKKTNKPTDCTICAINTRSSLPIAIITLSHVNQQGDCVQYDGPTPTLSRETKNNIARIRWMRKKNINCIISSFCEYTNRVQSS